MHGIVASLKKLVGRIKEMAAWWTSIGALLIPIGVVLLLETSGSLWGLVARILVFLGITSMFAGLIYFRREENHKNDAAKAEEQRRITEEKRIQEAHIEYLTTLRVIAKQLGANSVRTRRQAEKEVERYRNSSANSEEDEEFE